MPYLKLTTPPLTTEKKAQAAWELTEAVVALMAHGRGPSPEEMRERCTVHFTPYEPEGMAIGGKLMRDRGHADYTLEFSDWSLGKRSKRRLARELTGVLARLFGVPDDRLDQVNIRFHPYPPEDFAVGGRLLSELIPWIARLMKKILS